MAILAQHTAYNRSFLMVLSSDSRTGATGQTVAVSISKNGGPFALPTGLVTEIGFGWYQLALTPLDTDTLGDLDVHCTSAICDATDFVDEVKTSAQIAAITGPTTAFGATLTRDELITMAYKDIGALEEGEQLAGEKLQDGVKKLNNIVREFDATGKWLWCMKSSSITLVANQFVYTQASGFPADLREPDRVIYRDQNADDWPVDLVTTENYSSINNKTQTGDPNKAWITADRVIGTQTLTIWPAPSVVNPTSIVLGTDGNAYSCIRGHTSDSTTQPITGANWRIFWSLGGSGAVAWTTGTAYTSPLLLLIYYRRPLYDFTNPGDNPDFPTQWTRFLEYRLAHDLADLYGIVLEERTLLAEKAKGAYESIFKSTKPQTTDYHNKAMYL